MAFVQRDASPYPRQPLGSNVAMGTRKSLKVKKLSCLELIEG